MTEQKARKTCCNDQFHVKASCVFFHENNSNFKKSIKFICTCARKLLVCIGFVIGCFKWSVTLFVVGVDDTDRQIALQHVEMFVPMFSLQILQFYLSCGVRLKNELGIKCREVGI